MNQTDAQVEAAIREARFLGADAAATVAGLSILSETDASLILNQPDGWADAIDVSVPNLSGEWADDPTPISLAHDCGLSEPSGEDISAICDAWEQGRDWVFTNALMGVALRSTGDIVRALKYENKVDETCERLRRATLD